MKAEVAARAADEDCDSGTESDHDLTQEEAEQGSEPWSEEVSSEPSSGCSVRSRPGSHTSTDTLTCLDLPPLHPPPQSQSTLTDPSQLVHHPRAIPICPSVQDNSCQYRTSSLQSNSSHCNNLLFRPTNLATSHGHTYLQHPATALQSSCPGYSLLPSSFDSAFVPDEYSHHTRADLYRQPSHPVGNPPLSSLRSPGQFQSPPRFPHPLANPEYLRHPLAALHQTPSLLSSSSSFSSFRVLHHDYTLPELSYPVPASLPSRHSRPSRLHPAHKVKCHHPPLYSTHSVSSRSSSKTVEARSSSATALDVAALPSSLHLSFVSDSDYSTINNSSVSSIRDHQSTSQGIHLFSNRNNVQGSQPLEFFGGQRVSPTIQYQNTTTTPGSSGGNIGLNKQEFKPALHLGDLRDSLPRLQALEESNFVVPEGDYSQQSDNRNHSCSRSLSSPYINTVDCGVPRQNFESPCIVHHSDCFGGPCTCPLVNISVSQAVKGSNISRSPYQGHDSLSPCLSKSRDFFNTKAMSNTANSSSNLATRRMRSLRSHHNANRHTSGEGDDVTSPEAEANRQERDRSESPNIRATMTHHHHHRHHHHHHTMRTGGPTTGSELQSTGGGDEANENSENLASDCEDCDDCDNIGACGGGCEECDLIEHHSSEEELETLTGSWQRESNGPPEKRKWSQVARLSLTDSGSSDDEVCVLTTNERPPVQFRSTPPLEVHKPLRTVSPPSKMLGLGSPPTAHSCKTPCQSDSCRNINAGEARVVRAATGIGLGGLETHILGGVRSSSGLQVSARDSDRAVKSDSDAGSVVGRAASPRKRHRHTGRHHNRPSLDFEKMQQVNY
ncbi:hypothetical protein FHG87_014476 [Trinorchestia longiramus]|nr:hypothetical protein FHG87_014476 [Trinorchestia longiramus]